MGTRSDARKRHAASEALYVAPDGYGDLTIWLPRPGHPFGDWPVMSRTDRNALGFDALVALIGGAS